MKFYDVISLFDFVENIMDQYNTKRLVGVNFFLILWITFLLALNDISMLRK